MTKINTFFICVGFILYAAYGINGECPLGTYPAGTADNCVRCWGTRFFNEINLQKRVIGGQVVTEIGKYPTRVLIKRKYVVKDQGVEQKLFCSGTLITRRTILTSADCLAHYENTKTQTHKDYTVYLIPIANENNEINYKAKGVLKLAVKEVIKHDNYNRLTKSYNVGLIILKKSCTAKFKENNVGVACLPSTDPNLSHIQNQGDSLFFAGIENDNILSSNLKEVSLRVLPQYGSPAFPAWVLAENKNECDKFIEQHGFRADYHFFCLVPNDQTPKDGPCLHDVGGALYQMQKIYNENKEEIGETMVISGTVAYANFCEGDTIGVSTKMSSFDLIPWIQKRWKF